MLKPGIQKLLGLAILFSFAACSKNGSGSDDDSNHLFSANDKTPPEILIFTPSAGQVFSNGNSINITGRITDDLGLYRGTIKIVNDANGNKSTVFGCTISISATRFLFQHPQTIL